MDKNEQAFLREAVSSVKPYLNFPSELESKVEEISKESSNFEEFEEYFKNLISKQEDQSKKTDYRIFLNRIQNR